MSSENKCTCTFTQKMVGDGCSVCNPDFANGSYSESMGVDTRPAHKLEFGEHWILFSPSMSVEQFHQCADAVVHELKTPMDPLKPLPGTMVLFVGNKMPSNIQLAEMIQNIPIPIRPNPIEIVKLAKETLHIAEEAEYIHGLA